MMMMVSTKEQTGDGDELELSGGGGGGGRAGLCRSLGRHVWTLAASVAASFGSMALGSTIGYSSPACPDINSPDHDSPFRLDDSQVAWVASLISVGGMLGTPMAGALIDRYGRKTVLMLVAVPFVVGWLVVAGSTDVWQLYLGRVLTGLCCGVVDVAAPVYIAEISPTDIRGLTGSLHELSTNVGLLFVFGFGCVLRWNWLAVACVLSPVLLLLLAVSLMPESPRWLVAAGRPSDAKRVLQWLRRRDDVAVELAAIELNVRLTSSSAAAGLKDVISDRAIYRPFVIIASLMFFQQFAGYSIIAEFMVHIFQSSATSLDYNGAPANHSSSDYNGAPGNHSSVDYNGTAAAAFFNPFVHTAIVGAFGVAANLTAALIVDRAGRRRMLVLSAVIMTLSISALATFFTLKHHRRGAVGPSRFAWAPLLSLVAYNTGVSLGYGPVPFFLAGELFPLRARGLAAGLAISLVWFFMFVTNLGFPHAVHLVHEHGVYWAMAGFAALGALFVLAAVPETKGKSLEQIERYFNR